MCPSEPEIVDEDIRLFLEAIKSRSIYDFTNYSMKSLKRRITKIMSDSKLNMTELIKVLGYDRKFLDKVVKSIPVNTTELFRDPKIWRSLMYDVLPQYLNREAIKIWHPGCSTGQEVYSMMIILSRLGILEKSEIYASDINSDVLDTAREGKYQYRFNQHFIDNFNFVINSDRNLPDSLLLTPHDNYFSTDWIRDLIKMKSFLTAKPYYKVIDLVRDENLFNTKFDLIICRNVIIYFNTQLQNKVLNLFYENLNRDGCLVLGLHESIVGECAYRFDKKNHVYFKREE